jgi:hypothetical protein
MKLQKRSLIKICLREFLYPSTDHAISELARTTVCTWGACMLPYVDVMNISRGI